MGTGVWTRVALAVGVICLCSHTAIAEEGKVDYARDGGYVSFGALYAIPDAGLDAGTTFGNDIDDSWGFDSRVGYRMHPNVGWDMQFQYYNQFTGRTDGVRVAKFNGQSFTTNIKLNFLTGRIQPYFTGGIGFLRFETDKVTMDFAGRIAGGVDAYLTGNVVLYAEASYLLAINRLADFRLIPTVLGIQYRFGD